MLWDGCLFIPEKWFSPETSQRRVKAEIPSERLFHTTIELGREMLERAQASGLTFEALAFDSLYGRRQWLGQRCQHAEIEY
jgi:hypothetical protein